jgi:hypothetical protein
MSAIFTVNIKIAQKHLFVNDFIKQAIAMRKALRKRRLCEGSPMTKR